MSWLIDVVMPVYNAEPYLEEAIESILNQRFVDFWFIIIDDGSTDGSRGILQKYAKIDSRIQLLRNQKNSGICTSLNTAIKHSNATYILRMDADDISHPDRINLQLHFMQDNPDVCVCGCNMELIWAKNKKNIIKRYPISDALIRKNIFFFNPISHPWSIFRKDIFTESWWYDTDFILAEDLHLWFTLWKYGKLANIPKTLLKYREYETNSTHKKMKKMIKQTIKVRMYAIKKLWYNPWIVWWVAIAFTFIIQYLPTNMIYFLFYKMRWILK